jgi:hypothetical protein
MRLLIDCFNESTPKYLLFDINDQVDEQELIAAFDKIVLEYEDLKKTREYQNHLQKEDSKIYRKYQYLALHVALHAVTLKNFKSANEIIEAFKFDIKPEPESILHLIKSFENIFEIEKINQAKEIKEPTNWEDMRVFIHQTLNILPEYDCTVAQYCSYEKSAISLIEQRKKQHA